jgi:hypothetical protein
MSTVTQPIITVESKTQWALDWEKNSNELAATTVTMVELRELCRCVPPTLIGPTMPSSSDAIKTIEHAKVVQIDTEDRANTIQIGEA